MALGDLETLSAVNLSVARVRLPVEASLVSLVMTSVWLGLKLLRFE